jgi:hypothetical protein
MKIPPLPQTHSTKVESANPSITERKRMRFLIKVNLVRLLLLPNLNHLSHKKEKRKSRSKGIKKAKNKERTKRNIRSMEEALQAQKDIPLIVQVF